MTQHLTSSIGKLIKLTSHSQNPFLVIFCSTGLPQAKTRWVQSKFSSHCPLSSNRGRWLTSATSIFFPLKFFSGTLGIEPGAVEEAQAAPLSLLYLTKLIINSPMVHWKLKTKEQILIISLRSDWDWKHPCGKLLSFHKSNFLFIWVLSIALNWLTFELKYEENL